MHYIVYLLQFSTKFEMLYSDFNYLKPGFFHLTGQPYFQKGRAAKVIKVIYGIISEDKFVGTFSVDRLIDTSFQLKNNE
jgi:hypothetical protein